MRSARLGIAGLLLAGLLASSAAMAATKTYQVTGRSRGPRHDDRVQKGKDRCEIARDASTKVTEI